MMLYALIVWSPLCVLSNNFNFVQNLADNRILPNSEESGLSVVAADGCLTPTLIQGIHH